jgi:hypothetical protein
MHARISGAALTKALRCRRTVSVCAVLRRAKRGRFAYFALRLAPNHLMLYARIRRNLTHSSPDWVAASLARACWVVVCRSSPLEGMLPVGIRGNSLCRRLRIRLSEKVAPRTDVLIETGTGAIALDEYVRGGMPILLPSSTGPKLVYNPWEIAHECCFHISRTGVPGTGDASFSSESSSRHSHSG